MSTIERQRTDMLNLLEELQKKKRWLDVVIAGLEDAVASPHLRLIKAAGKAFGGMCPPYADLSAESIARLSGLAAQVSQHRLTLACPRTNNHG